MDKPVLFDIYNSFIVYILENDIRSKIFYAIDVGQIKNEAREIEENYKGQKEPVKF